MIDVRRFASLGAARFDWLDARHHFSFGQYHDPARMGWGKIRVWNDDTILPGAGFAPHAHSDMEIITYVRKGAISHRDSLGNTGRTAAGDVQVMSAGAGIRHSEYNLEAGETQIFQIWIEPATRGGPPAWAAAQFPQDDRAGQLVTLASNDTTGAGGLTIRQDARVLGANLRAGQRVRHALGAGRHAYLVLAEGAALVNGVAVSARDGAALKDAPEIDIIAQTRTELVLVDAP